LGGKRVEKRPAPQGAIPTTRANGSASVGWRSQNTAPVYPRVFVKAILSLIQYKMSLKGRCDSNTR
jgi:hypothetical protein